MLQDTIPGEAVIDPTWDTYGDLDFKVEKADDPIAGPIFTLRLAWKPTIFSKTRLWAIRKLLVLGDKARPGRSAHHYVWTNNPNYIPTKMEDTIDVNEAHIAVFLSVALANASTNRDLETIGKFGAKHTLVNNPEIIPLIDRLKDKNFYAWAAQGLEPVANNA